MQDAEIALFENAKSTFAEAFTRGLTRGTSQADGGAPPREDISFPFFIDIPRTDVVENDFAKHTESFEEAGRVSALASGRRGRVYLDATNAHPGSLSGGVTGVLRWTIAESST